MIEPERAQKIAPANSLIDDGFMITIHTDAPVATPNQMTIIWASVNRTFRSGTVMGPDERISTYQALQGITINTRALNRTKRDHSKKVNLLIW